KVLRKTLKASIELHCAKLPASVHQQSACINPDIPHLLSFITSRIGTRTPGYSSKVLSFMYKPDLNNVFWLSS
ncbi:MAG TPA: hypothetical protein VFN95_08835, partial [Flavitalea sp.]|nr:hypothetical protein [Flavitalea sp.]